MRTLVLLSAVASFLPGSFLKAQDTFSILAFDSVTHEVGGAGASCVDLFAAPIPLTNDFIIELFPGQGAVATQANYMTANQVAIRNRFTAGDSPAQMMGFMQANDQGLDPSVRQYGAVRLGTVYPRAAAFTGSNCMAWKNHIVGPNYTIQGNILLGQQVLDSMEARFKREPGDLSCKLMAAMQGAKMVGADSRCAGNGSSSLFAFLKVSQPGDPLGQPSFIVSMRSATGAGIEPIDSLQTLFSNLKNCNPEPVGVQSQFNHKDILVYPNPASQQITVDAGEKKVLVVIRDPLGRTVYEKPVTGKVIIPTLSWPRGVYLLELNGWAQKINLGY